MTRITLPNLTFFFALAMCGALLSAPAQAGDGKNKMRVDCRYFSSSSRFCYSSAIYNVSKNGEIDDLHFGIGCDYETIYDDTAISPQDELSDTIRPRTAALPRIELNPKGSLRHAGTYTSKLEIDSGRLTDGTCYVREVDESESDSDYFRRFQDQLYFQ